MNSSLPLVDTQVYINDSELDGPDRFLDLAQFREWNHEDKWPNAIFVLENTYGTVQFNKYIPKGEVDDGCLKYHCPYMSTPFQRFGTLLVMGLLSDD